MTTTLFPRKIGLVVYNSGQGPPSPSGPGTGPPNSNNSGIDLSQLRIVFKTFALEADAPPTAIIRVYNLADATAQKVQNEFQYVILQAGYEGSQYGVIFQGSIIRVRKGRESNIDSFVEIMASQLDAFYNYGVVSASLGREQSSWPQQTEALLKSANDHLESLNLPTLETASIKDTSALSATGGVLPRGKVLFGLARARLTDIAKSTNVSWSIVNGQLQFTKLDDYAPGTAVQLNWQTGVVGVPEATVNGIEVTSLLNPLIQSGTQVQLNNKDVTTTSNLQALGFPNYTAIQLQALLSADGFYKVIVVEHEGDSRGNPWYTRLICLNLDHSNAASPVNAFNLIGTKDTQ